MHMDTADKLLFGDINVKRCFNIAMILPWLLLVPDIIVNK